MKKLLSSLLAATLLLGTFAGCASPAPAGSSTPPPASAASTAAESQAADPNAPKEFENKELSIAIFEGGYGPDYWVEMVSKFEAAYPGVKVNMQINPQIANIIRPQIVSGNVPDFISMNDNDSSGLIASMIKEKSLLEISDVFESNALNTETKLKDAVLEGVLETVKCQPYGDGKIYLAPFNAGPLGLVYNKHLFETKGWELPITWDEFFALGDKAKAEGIALFTYQGIYPSYLESMLYPAIASSVGMDDFNKVMTYKEGSFNNPEVLAILNNLQKIATGGYLMEGTVALNHTQSQTDMMMDKALFIPNGVWMEGEMKDAPRAEGFVFGITPSPVMKASDPRYVMTSLEQFSIPKGAKNPELAKEFLRFLYTDDSVKSFAEKANGIYALKGANELVKGIVSDGVYNMSSVYSDAKAVSMITGWAAIPKGSKVVANDVLYNPVTDIMNNKMTTQKWAEDVEKAFAQVRADEAAAG